MPAAGRPPLRLALFDCDGTLVDGQFAIIDAMTQAWADHGLGEPDPMEVRRMVGLSLVEAVSLLLPTHDAEGHVAVAESYKRAFSAARGRGEVDEPLFPGIVDTLAALEEAGVLLGVAAGETGRLAEAVDEEPVALLGGHPAGAGVRLAQVALLLEGRHVVADGGGRHVHPGRGGDAPGPDRLGRVDVLLHHRAEDLGLSIVEAHRGSWRGRTLERRVLGSSR